jgi:hypothetical protein
MTTLPRVCETIEGFKAFNLHELVTLRKMKAR